MDTHIELMKTGLPLYHFVSPRSKDGIPLPPTLEQISKYIEEHNGIIKYFFEEIMQALQL